MAHFDVDILCLKKLIMRKTKILSTILVMDIDDRFVTSRVLEKNKKYIFSIIFCSNIYEI